MLTIEGVIVRRSCMGKRLSFCDVQLEDGPGSSDKTSNHKEEEEERSSIMKVSFRRDSNTWDEANSPHPFPIKTSELPYGARVEMTLEKGEEMYEVASWQIVTHPKQVAEEIASQGQPSNGISYSAYLRERGNEFATIQASKKLQHGHGNKKRPRSNSSKVEGNSNGISEAVVAHNSNDDLGNGQHGDKQAKATRARLFAQWVLKTFSPETLRQGTGVLDIAGGKGNLSVELAATGQIPATVIDPMIRKKQQSFPVKRDAKRIRKAKGPLPRHLPTFFNQEDFLEQYGQTKTSVEEATTKDTPTNNTDAAADDEQNHNNESLLVTNASCLIGLHPDQSTQDILEVALKYNKNVAIVPCCVFPSFFPLRQLHDGTPVVTHADFVQYLLERDNSLQKDTLPFEGRNVVIYRKVV